MSEGTASWGCLVRSTSFCQVECPCLHSRFASRHVQRHCQPGVPSQHTVSPGRMSLPRTHLHRGVTLVEVMITVSILTLVAGGATMLAFERYEEAKLKAAKMNAYELRRAVLHYLIEGTGCPDVHTLVERGVLDRASDRKDPWGSPFTVTCPEGDVMVASPGPDRAEWTADDILVPDLSEYVDPFAQGTITGPGWTIADEEKGLSFEQWLDQARSERAAAPMPDEAVTTVDATTDQH